MGAYFLPLQSCSPFLAALHIQTTIRMQTQDSLPGLVITPLKGADSSCRNSHTPKELSCPLLGAVEAAGQPPTAKHIISRWGKLVEREINALDSLLQVDCPVFPFTVPLKLDCGVRILLQQHFFHRLQKEVILHQFFYRFSRLEPTWIVRLNQ